VAYPAADQGDEADEAPPRQNAGTASQLIPGARRTYRFGTRSLTGGA
jgi:hypothetical protein